ncbi:GNAT family N-acetyltransferase [Methylobacterium durans]|uniref:GNAT family N-acetyltransferase n=1 Tax=Methylobacterium durans TaxID=2202825 RepID=UPI002AFEDAAC|nr:GNAT family N-acetyltransferase [Methylobacterium durans]MEA1833925.1 GNAT family N-acetyltransferase [Methylobacterium durans]
MTSARPDCGITIRTMDPSGLGTALDWAAAEGWNPGLNDAACFRAADPAGFLMLYDGDAPAGSISVVRYPEAFGFLGLFIVRPDRRGRGFGRRLWEAGLTHLDGCTIGLDGVVARQASYGRAGFATAHRNIRYAGEPRRSGPPDPRIVPIDEALLPALIAYDRRFFPAPREMFLRCWLGGEGRRAKALLEGSAILGYGVVRACRVGHKVGPLFAQDPGVAAALLNDLVAGLAGPVALDLPEPNGAGLRLAESYGLAPVFETARMYRGAPPDLPLGETFGITTFELG